MLLFSASIVEDSQSCAALFQSPHVTNLTFPAALKNRQNTPGIFCTDPMPVKWPKIFPKTQDVNVRYTLCVYVCVLD